MQEKNPNVLQSSSRPEVKCMNAKNYGLQMDFLWAWLNGSIIPLMYKTDFSLLHATSQHKMHLLSTEDFTFGPR